jgi:hypothetical protein
MNIIFASLTNARRQAALLYPEQVTIQSMCVKAQPNMKNLLMFKPTEDMVFGYKHWECNKNGTIDHRWDRYEPVSDKQYREQYDEILRSNNPYIVDWYLGLDTNPNVTMFICCYCTPNTFCHRRRVYKYLKEVIDVRYTQHHTILLDPTNDELKDMKLDRAQRFLEQEEEMCPNCEGLGCDDCQGAN